MFKVSQQWNNFFCYLLLSQTIFLVKQCFIILGLQTSVTIKEKKKYHDVIKVNIYVEII